MQTLLYHHERHGNGKLLDFRKVSCELKEDGRVLIVCCDINDTAYSMWGDRGVEFFVSLKPVFVYKLCALLKLAPQDRASGLTGAVKARFEGEECFEDFMRFCQNNGLPYQYDRW